MTRQLDAFLSCQLDIAAEKIRVVYIETFGEVDVATGQGSPIPCTHYPYHLLKFMPPKLLILQCKSLWRWVLFIHSCLGRNTIVVYEVSSEGLQSILECRFETFVLSFFYSFASICPLILPTQLF